jgi:hypothetical protein
MKAPERRQASSGVVGEQLTLIDPPPFSPKYPSRTTLAGEALALLLAGYPLTHPQFEGITNSWRLSEPIRALRHDFGWPVETIEIPAPTAERPDRYIARYVLPDWVRQQVGAVLLDGRGTP